MKKRILFVDDEPNILQGLKRMLRSQRHEWDMTFVESGKQALEVLEHAQFEAVVSDMRMPGMDGAELLNKVKDLYPKMIRFVLSGHSDQELVMRSVGPSHQYLAKPCEPDLLKDKLSAAFTLHTLLRSDEIRTIVAGMTSLPSLPHIYREVVEELQSDDVSIMAVGKLIEQDPGMATKVLQLVNSAYFGIGRQLTSPAEAANFIGLDILKSLVLSEGVFSQFDPAVIEALSLDAVKSKSLLIAQSARQIAKSENADEILCDQAFLAGLLHDMGSLVLAANLPDDYLRACKIAEQDGIDIWDAEQQVFGTSHAEVAAYLLGLWGIDDDVVAAVAYHHKPEHYHAAQFSALTAVYVAST
jgi:HD-like signal output (HDOD) protein